jgi:hypothetical protein
LIHFQDDVLPIFFKLPVKSLPLLLKFSLAPISFGINGCLLLFFQALLQLFALGFKLISQLLFKFPHLLLAPVLGVLLLGYVLLEDTRNFGLQRLYGLGLDLVSVLLTQPLFSLLLLGHPGFFVPLQLHLESGSLCLLLLV